MELPKREGLLQQLIRTAAEGHAFLLICLLLAGFGSLTALYPVTAVVVPAALLQPRRWPAITLVTALGSAIGATLLVSVFYQLGWTQIYEKFPELASNVTWHRIIEWATTYGEAALLVIAASPLPQTPALIFFAVAQHDYPSIFIAMLAGKLLKYGVVAWLSSHFPERFGDGLRGLFRRAGKRLGG